MSQFSPPHSERGDIANMEYQQANSAELIAEFRRTAILLAQILDQLKTVNEVCQGILKMTNSGVRIQEPLLVEVDGVVAVVGH
jgi:hypothetical protein